jgi:hypothetical protein
MVEMEIAAGFPVLVGVQTGAVLHVDFPPSFVVGVKGTEPPA